jgi:hypothetical protein
LDLQNPEFAAVVADLASPLRGVPKDELASEEVRQHKRTVRTAWAAGLVVLVLAGAAAVAAMFALDQRNEAEAQAREAERQTDIAEQALEDAEEQARLARLAQVEAEAEAARADRTAQRLIDLLIRPEDPRGRGGFFEVPRDARGLTVPPTSLPIISELPASDRLDFQQTLCRVDACFTVPAFVRDEPPSRTVYELDGGTLWLAGEPFHIRHGFEGVGPNELERAISAGYSVHAFATRVAGPQGSRFEIDVPYRIEASAAIEIVGEPCGPVVYPSWDQSQCAQWIIDFPEGLPAGAFELGVEWTAPCADWFESDACPLPKPVGLNVAGGIVSFIAENFGSFQDRADLGWPFDPWSRSEPIPESEG